MSMPLTLYIHIPWCIRKCPYCDFNSHKSPEELPEDRYVTALIDDLKQDLLLFEHRPIDAIFIGGGTPSLFSARAYERLFKELRCLLPFKNDIEITLEANPGSVEQERFKAYRAVGINRISLGIQSFNKVHLKALGRIHNDNEAHLAIETALLAGFDNINIDLMHGLPHQTREEGLMDLKEALNHAPTHLSWYQLTIEPNTIFYKKRPPLPSEDDAYALEEEGFALLEKHHFNRYEISAFCQNNKVSRHNLNYWLFGDYLGIGAGAHGKITTNEGMIRTRKVSQPTDYLNTNKPFMASCEKISDHDLLFEFMLNTSRLQQSIPKDLFFERTGLPYERLEPFLQKAQAKGLVNIDDSSWQITSLGRWFTNDLQGLFLG